ncbi:class I SAM-dependent DNA methyltransferase [Rhodoblastus sp.]|uniref:class I SAM-dependent DNA methyltransferase n=2 Tax=Rhodoblastus sp. TaxID=1962975 RepID=UPI003F9C17B1
MASSSRSPAQDSAPAAVEAFIARWQGRDGGQERANYAMFLREFCGALQLPPPDPAGESETNDYVFERAVKDPGRDGGATSRRIDLYKRDCFVLEAKQSRQQKGGEKEVHGQADLFVTETASRGRRGPDRAWDVLMFNARSQAENYVRLLPAGHEPPPFVIVCDVGHCFEIYANFRRDGKAFDQFPDRQSFRVYLEDLRRPEIRDLLAAIWTDPLNLDPAQKSARVTRDIAKRLAAVSKALEAQKFPAEEVAMFLMRCLFTMFAEDVGLLPEKSFKDVLERCEQDPDTFRHDVGQLWEAMDVGGYAHAIRKKVARFNGEFFRRRTVLPMGREEIGELRQAASYNWRDVDPSIFGTLLEQALDPNERRRLGAHYTPRAYVERLVVATIIEPLRAEWAHALATIERKKGEIAALGPRDPARDKILIEARGIAVSFHGRLCATRVLDPACGTGNFLYVALELMKRLEGEVIDVVEALGGQESATWLDRQNVDPHQFLGLEINPRAAAIAELVLWIGFLQWHFRTRADPPPEPILHAFRNIAVKDAVLEADIFLARDAAGKPITRRNAEGETVETYSYGKPRRPEWPASEYIVGNPPFIGGKDLRARLGDEYVQALWAAHKDMNESADFVMYWWDRAADLLTRKGTILRRFGFVTTNSISQVFQRRVMERHLRATRPVSIIMAIPDHPWSKAAPDAAAVRIAMTVCEAGRKDGVLREVVRELGLDSDSPVIDFSERDGKINSDLTVGVDVTTAAALLANEGVCSPGVKLHGAGFIVTPQEAEHLGLGRRPGLEKHIRAYRNGRDLTARPRGVLVIDLFGLTADDVRARFPEVYQHLQTTVKPERDAQFAKSATKDAESYARDWWLFGKPRQELRPALQGLSHYIATVETTKHRVFQFLDASILPDNMLVNVGSDDAFILGVLSSRFHVAWALRAGGWLGIGNDPRYSKSRCFDPFPFPDADDLQKQRIRAVAEDLDAHRKRVLADHPHLTLTGLYNVLEKLKHGVAPEALEPNERRIFDDGLVLILKELHDRLDAAVAEAYGWPEKLSDDEILARLVALNKERAAEEARGTIRWLRPDYQISRFGSPKEKAELDLVGGGMAPTRPLSRPPSPQGGREAPAGPKPAFPAEEVMQTAAVMAALAGASTPLDADAIARSFKQGRKIAHKIAAVLSALARVGFVTTGDGGRTFRLPRAA